MKNENKSLIVVLVYVLVMLVICLITVNILKKESVTDINFESTEGRITVAAQTIYIPIYVGSVPSESEYIDSENTTESEEYFILREYNEKIGIFASDNKLLQIIDVYVKTLPKADRKMLEEGIEIRSVEELNEIIEDYTC